MPDYKIYTEENAPEASKALLANAKETFSFIPNLFGVMAESPNLLQAYKTVNELFKNSSFNREEMAVVWLSVSVENACHYCVPVHSGLAKYANISDEIINALRKEIPLPDPKLEALRAFTLKVMRHHGSVNEADTEAFLAAGYTKRHILEVILGYTQKIMSNYTNQLAKTPLDDQLMKQEWLKTA